MLRRSAEQDAARPWTAHGTCFQRSVGIDALNALRSVTFDLDRSNGAGYHDRFTDFVARIQRSNRVTGGGRSGFVVCSRPGILSANAFLQHPNEAMIGMPTFVFIIDVFDELIAFSGVDR
jgi:hypothetical protein